MGAIKGKPLTYKVVITLATHTAEVMDSKQALEFHMKPSQFRVIDTDFKEEDDAIAYRKEHYPHYTDKLTDDDIATIEDNKTEKAPKK